MLRVNFEGRSYDVLEYELDVIPTMTDYEIRQKLARFFAVRVDRLRDYVVDRTSSSYWTVRPEAVYSRPEETRVTMMTL